MDETEAAPHTQGSGIHKTDSRTSSQKYLFDEGMTLSPLPVILSIPVSAYKSFARLFLNEYFLFFSLSEKIFIILSSVYAHKGYTFVA